MAKRLRHWPRPPSVTWRHRDRVIIVNSPPALHRRSVPSRLLHPVLCSCSENTDATKQRDRPPKTADHTSKSKVRRITWNHDTAKLFNKTIAPPLRCEHVVCWSPGSSCNRRPLRAAAWITIINWQPCAGDLSMHNTTRSVAVHVHLI